MSGDVARVTRLIRRVKDGDVSVNTSRKQAVLTHLRTTREPVHASEVPALLSVTRIPNQLLAELMAEGLLRRTRIGRYWYYDLDPTHPDNQPEEG